MRPLEYGGIERRYRWYREEGRGPILPDPATSPPYSYEMRIGLLNTDGYGHVGYDTFGMDGIDQASPFSLSWLFSGQSTEEEPTQKMVHHTTTPLWDPLQALEPQSGREGNPAQSGASWKGELF